MAKESNSSSQVDGVAKSYKIKGGEGDSPKAKGDPTNY